MAGASEEESGKGKLDVFDGSRPSEYRLWKRRAQLMLACLPSTIAETKHAAKLLSYIGGEAEHLLEHLPVEKLCSEGGVKLVWEVLDEKYGDQPIDLLQESMRTFFHELQVKPAESFRQFSARFYAARRRIEEQEVKLPEVALGFLFLKKLRLDSQGESMVLTATGGKLDLKQVEKAVQSIFPEGKGAAMTNKANTKEVFAAEAEAQDMQEVLEMLAEEAQGNEEYDEEETLEAYETYTEIRKKMMEQKKSRGYYPGPAHGRQKESWQLTGTVQGKLEAMKARTKCFVCKKNGHWKRECPMRQKSSASTAESKGKEVHIIEDEQGNLQKMWDVFHIESEEDKVMDWGENLPNDVRNSGNADTHSTGNRQRHDVPDFRETVVHEHGERRLGEDNFGHFGHEVFEMSLDVLQGEHELSAHVSDPSLATCGVPDTACRRTLVGQETLAQIEKCLKKQGYKIHKAKVSSEFRFGNNGTLMSREVALLPANIAGKRVVIKAAILPEQGRNTPLLLSKELLKQLGCVLDLSSDCVEFKRLGRKVKLGETNKGHYAIPLFLFADAAAAECHASERKKVRGDQEKEYDITQLEELGEHKHESGFFGSVQPLTGPPGTEDSHVPTASFQRDLGDASRCEDGRSPETRDHSGRLPRQGGGCTGQSHRASSYPEDRQVQEGKEDHVGSVSGGQELRPMVPEPHQPAEPSGDEKVQGVHRLCGCPEAGPSTDRDKEEGPVQKGELFQCHSQSEGSSGEVQGKDGEQEDEHGLGRGGLGGKELGRGDGGQSGFRSERFLSTEHTMSKKSRNRLKRNVQYLAAIDSCADHGNHRDEISDFCLVNLDRSVDSSEVFSAPRISVAASEKGLRADQCYDIQSGWDFLKADHRKRCLEEIRAGKPKHVHVCPPRGPYSTMQNISKNGGGVGRDLVEAKVLVNFGVQVCSLQLELGSDFSFACPEHVASWGENNIRELEQRSGVFRIFLDQCCFGLRDPENGDYYRKPTSVLTSNECLVPLLGKTCKGDHIHQKLKGKVKVGSQWVHRTRCAQVYPKSLCRAFAKGIQQKVGQQEVFAVEKMVGIQESLGESVRRCHVNLGHPSKEKFLNMLKTAGASEQTLKVAKELKCDVCLARHPPNLHPVVNTKRAEGFNQQISMDVFDVDLSYPKVKKLKMLNILCEGTGLQMVVPLWKGASSDQVRKAYRKFWLRWAGSPKRVHTDGGPEFDGSCQTGFDRDGSHVTKSAAEAPWQNSRCEKAGGLWKDVFYRACEDCIPRTREEYNELFDKVSEARNSMMRKHGFAPYQHVFGCDLRIPQGLLDHEENTVHLSGVLHGVEEFVRAQEIRQSARKAMVACDDTERIRRATLYKARPQRGPFLVGDYVFYWRKGRETKVGSWKGPGRIIGFFESRSKIWVSHGNKVLRCAPEQLRHLSTEQVAAIQFTTPDMLAPPPKGHKRGGHVFTDISQEGNPPSDEMVHEGSEEHAQKRQRVEVPVEDEHGGEPSSHHARRVSIATNQTDTQVGSGEVRI